MTWLDWLVVAMLVYFIIQGLTKGVTIVGLGAIAVIAAFLIAAMLLPTLGDALVAVKSPVMPPDLSAGWRRTVAFSVSFGVAYVLLLLLISVMPGGKRPSAPAQMLGIGGGVLKALLAAMAFVSVLLASPLSEAMKQDVERSALGGYVARLYTTYATDIQRVTRLRLPAVEPDGTF